MHSHGEQSPLPNRSIYTEAGTHSVQIWARPVLESDRAVYCLGGFDEGSAATCVDVSCWTLVTLRTMERLLRRTRS